MLIFTAAFMAIFVAFGIAAIIGHILLLEALLRPLLKADTRKATPQKADPADLTPATAH